MPESRANFAARTARLAVLPGAHTPDLCWSRLLDTRAPPKGNLRRLALRQSPATVTTAGGA